MATDLLKWEVSETAEDEEVRADANDVIPADASNADPVRTNAEGRPNPQWVRGTCPDCGDDLVSNLYYVAGRGYLIAWECWASLSENPSCSYKRVL